jgi:hypothetical protein
MTETTTDDETLGDPEYLTGISAVVTQKLRGARALLAIAIDHYERSHEAVAPERKKVRRAQAASAVGQSIGLLGEAGWYLTAEAMGEVVTGHKVRRRS